MIVYRVLPTLLAYFLLLVILLSIAALNCEEPVTVTGVEALDKSWPDYLSLYRALGGRAE